MNMNQSTQPYAKPLPRKEPLNWPFWEHAKAHRLAMQHCPRCNDLRFPATHVCPVCLADAQDWKVVSGNATVLYWVRIHRAYWPGFAGELPYTVCAVQLVEGPVLLTNLVGIAHEEIRSGMPVHAVFEDVTAELTLPKFGPAAAAAD